MTIIYEGWLTTILHGTNCWIFTKNHESECNVYEDIRGKISNSEIVYYFLQAMWESDPFQTKVTLDGCWKKEATPKATFLVNEGVKEELESFLLCEDIKLGLQMEEEDIEEGKALFLGEQYNTEKQDEITKEETEKAHEDDLGREDIVNDHYHDDCVDMRIISEFCLWVLVNNEGDAVSLSYETWHFHAHDLLEAYGQLIDELDLDEEDRKTHILKFKQYLIDTGTPEEELED